MSATNVRAKGNNLTKLFHVTCHEAGLRIWAHLLGNLHPKIWDGQTSKVRRDFGQLQILIANISGTD